MDDILNLLKALADRNRLRVVAALLYYDELCACQLTELLGVAGATASRHLAQMQTAGILSSRKEGRWSFFKLDESIKNQFPLEWLTKNLEESDEIIEDRERLTAILKEKPETICRRQRQRTISAEKREG